MQQEAGGNESPPPRTGEAATIGGLRGSGCTALRGGPGVGDDENGIVKPCWPPLMQGVESSCPKRSASVSDCVLAAGSC